MTDEIALKFRADDSDLDRAGRKIQGFGSDIDKQFTQAANGGGISSFMGKITQLGFGIFGLQQTIQGVGSIAKGLFSSNIEFESFEAEFKVLLGSADAAKARLEELAEFGRTTPFELPEIVRASKTLETFTKGALSTGEGLTLVGDVASGTGVRIDELAMWFGRLYDGLQSGRPVGEAMMRLQELGAISGEARSEIEAMQEAGVDGSVVWETFADSVSRFSGTMDEKSKTVGGALSNISDGIGQLKRNLLQGIFEAAKPGLMSFAELLGNPKLQAGAESLGKAVGEGLGMGVRFLAEGIGMVLGPLIDLGRELVGPVKDGVSWLKDNVPDAAKAVYDWAQQNKLLVSMISPAAGALLLLVDNWDKVKQTFGKGLDFGADLFGGIKEQVGLFASGFQGDLFAGGMSDEKLFGKSAVAWGAEVREAFDTAAAGFQTFADAVRAQQDDLKFIFQDLTAGDFSGALAQTNTMLEDFTSRLGVLDQYKGVISGIGAAFQEVKDAVAPAIAVLKPLVEDLAESFKGYAPAGQALKEQLLPALRELGPAAQALGSAALPTLKVIGEILGVTLVAAIAVIVMSLTQFNNFITMVLPPAIKGLALAIEVVAPAFQLAGVALETFAKTLDAIIQTIAALVRGDWDQAWTEFKRIFTTAFDGLVTAIGIYWDTVKAAFTEWIPKLAGIALDLVLGLVSGWNDSTFHIVTAIQEFGLSIPGKLGNVKDWLVDVGWDLMRGLADAIRAAYDSTVGAALSWVTDKIPFSKGPPAKDKVLLEPVGRLIMTGLASGLESGFNESVEPALRKFGPEMYAEMRATMGEMSQTWSGLSQGFMRDMAEDLELWNMVIQESMATGRELGTAELEAMLTHFSLIIDNNGFRDNVEEWAYSAIDAMIKTFESGAGVARDSVLDLLAGLLAEVKAGIVEINNEFGTVGQAVPGMGDSPSSYILGSDGKWYASEKDMPPGVTGASTTQAGPSYSQAPSYAGTSFGQTVLGGSWNGMTGYWIWNGTSWVQKAYADTEPGSGPGARKDVGFFGRGGVTTADVTKGTVITNIHLDSEIIATQVNEYNDRSY